MRAATLHFAPDSCLDEIEHFAENQKASVASLRWCSPSARNGVRLPSGMLFSLAGIPRWQANRAQRSETFDILSDNSGNLGSLLATIPVPVIGDSVSRLYSASPATSLTLVAGTTYQIEAASPSGSDSFFWLQANPIGTATEFSSARSGTLPGQPSEAFPGCATGFRCSRTRHMAAFAFPVDPLGCQGRRSCRHGASARPSV